MGIIIIIYFTIWTSVFILVIIITTFHTLYSTAFFRRLLERGMRTIFPCGLNKVSGKKFQEGYQLKERRIRLESTIAKTLWLERQDDLLVGILEQW